MQTISSEPLDALLAVHLKPVNTGKARDSFTNPEHAFMRYVYVSDRLSSNDFNLGFGLRRHGEVRNASTIYWKLRLKEALIETDLIAFGSSIDAYLPNELQNIPELWKRMTVVVDADQRVAVFVQKSDGGGLELEHVHVVSFVVETREVQGAIDLEHEGRK